MYILFLLLITFHFDSHGVPLCRLRQEFQARVCHLPCAAGQQSNIFVVLHHVSSLHCCTGVEGNLDTTENMYSTLDTVLKRQKAQWLKHVPPKPKVCGLCQCGYGCAILVVLPRCLNRKLNRGLCSTLTMDYKDPDVTEIENL